MKEKNSDYLKISRLIFIICSCLCLIIPVAISLFILLTSSNIFFNSIEYLFNQIPLVGQAIYAYVLSFDIFNFSILYNKLFSPLILIELISLVAPIIIIQIILLVQQNIIIKKKNSFISATIAIILILSLLITQSTGLSLIRLVSPQIYQIKDFTIIFLLLIQLISFISMLINLSKLDRFNISKTNIKLLSYRFIKVGCILSLVLYVSISSIFLVINSQVNNLKEEIRINYVIDFKSTNDVIHLDVPDNIKNKLNTYGVSVPDTITGAKVLKQFGIEKIDIGKVVNNFVDSKINIVLSKLLYSPLLNSIISLLLVLTIFIINVLNREQTIYQKLFNYIQFILAFVLFFIIARHFTIIATIFTGLILIGTTIPIQYYLSKNKYYLRIKELLKNNLNNLS